MGTPGEVKGLMRGSVLELRCASPRRATELLRAHFPTGNVGLFGDRVHVATATPETAAGIIERALAEQGLAVTDLREIESSLEDVFISVLTRRETEENADDHRN